MHAVTYILYVYEINYREKQVYQGCAHDKVINDEKGRGVLSQQWQIEMNKSK